MPDPPAGPHEHTLPLPLAGGRPVARRTTSQGYPVGAPPVAPPARVPLRVDPPPRRFFGTLTSRAVLVTCSAALISVLVTALVAFPLAIRSADSQTRATLSRNASLAADVLTVRDNAQIQQRITRQMRQQGIDVYLVQAGQPDHSGLPARIVTAIATGHRVPAQIARVGGQLSLVVGQPLGAAAAGNGVVLAQPAVTGQLAGLVLGRLGLALLAGLVAGVLAGLVLAGRLSRPIRHAAAAATRLSAGERGVRIRPEPPAEVQDLAVAINGLASALATSENRQREFLLSVSHELRTPLTTIKGYAEALADGVVGPEGVQAAGQTMVAESEHLERLVTDLLSLARLDADDFPIEVLPVELNQLVHDTAQAWGGRCGQAGVLLQTELTGLPVIARTDPGRLRQVIDGLLENALRVVPPGAPVVLAVRGQHQPGAGWCAVEVRDGGPGFTDEDLAVAFERGALHERYRGIRKVGSGLGLALAAGLVRRVGGVIEAGHAPEGGARFTVRLPNRA